MTTTPFHLINFHWVKKLVLVILLVMTISSVFAQYPPEFKNSIYGANVKAGHYATINGFKMYYETYGKGEPLLLIHGNGGSINNFSGQIDYFAKKYKVIVADSRAHGKSVDTSEDLNYEMMAEDFNTLLDELKIKSCSVIGWSDGGNIGLLLAIHHPEKVKKLAVTGANIEIDSSAIANDVVAIDQLGPLYKLEQTPEVINTIKITKLLFMLPNISLRQLQSIKCPTLVIGGDHDVILPKHTLLIAENINQSTLWILPNSGHSTLINYKNLFNTTVEDFLKNPYRPFKAMERIN
jgi:pimeloyl-ACP methyl ester carboxylesterase